MEGSKNDNSPDDDDDDDNDDKGDLLVDPDEEGVVDADTAIV